MDTCHRAAGRREHGSSQTGQDTDYKTPRVGAVKNRQVRRLGKQAGVTGGWGVLSAPREGGLRGNRWPCRGTRLS